MKQTRLFLIGLCAVIVVIGIVVIGYRHLKAEEYIIRLIDHCLTYQASVGGQGSDSDARRCDSWAREYHARHSLNSEFCIDQFSDVDGCIRHWPYRLPPWPLGVRLPDDAADCNKVQCFNY